MAGKKKTQVARSSKSFPAQPGFQGLNPIGFRFPLDTDEPVLIEDEIQNALFQRCCELYRLIDLLKRQAPALIEAYSKFHSKHQFADALQTRFFGFDEAITARIEPDISARIFVLFNLLHELKVSLSCTESLPHTILSEMEGIFFLLDDGWEQLRKLVRERYGWAFRSVGSA